MALLNSVICIFCLYVYIFPFRIYGFDPRFLVFVLAIICYLYDKKKFDARIPYVYLRVLRIPVLIALWALVCIFLNTTSDYSFVIYPFQIIYLLVLSYATFYVLKSLHQNITYDTIVYYIISVLVCAGVIAILMFVNSSINAFFFEMQDIDITSRTILLYFEKRLIGLGCFYFGGGLIFGFGLILIMSLLLQPFSKKKHLLLGMLYLFVLVVGMFIARTCLVGFVISLILLFVNLLKVKIKKRILGLFFKFLCFLFFAAVLLIYVYNLFPGIKNDYSQIVDFGMELFINLFEGEELKTDSTEALKTMYNWPTDIKTYIYGDGYFIGDTIDTYYKNTDVGYLRLIYYFGILGAAFLFLQQIYVLFCINKYEENIYIKQMCILLFVYILLLNLKGYIDFSPILFIFLHYELYKYKKYEANSLFC